MSDDHSSSKPPFIHRHPWIILVIIFGVLIGAWTTMYMIASKNRHEKIPLEQLDAVPRSTPDFPAELPVPEE